MADIHTPDEWIAVSDLDAMVDVTLALVDLARTALMESRRLGPVVGLGTYGTFDRDAGARCRCRRSGASRPA